jgi:transketolase
MQESQEMRAVFTETLIHLAEQDPRVVVLDADLMKANGTLPFQERFPDRTFDVGIAEANMIGIAAGLSLEGFIPFPATFATFATRRCYDQAVLSNAYAGLNVKIVGTDPGVSSELNGGTHMPTEDIALMRSIPGNTVVEFVDCASVRALLPQIKDHNGPCYIRLFRKKAEHVYDDGVKLTLGKAYPLKHGEDVAIFCTGILVKEALDAYEILAAEGISAEIVNIHTIKPLDKEAIVAAAGKTGAVVTAENHSVINGLGSAVAEVLSEQCPVPMRRIGFQDCFGEVGKMDYLMKRFHLTAPDIVRAAKDVVAQKRTGPSHI